MAKRPTNTPITPVVVTAPRTSPTIGGAPAAPHIDPRAVTTAGQVLSPPSVATPNDMNATWGPVPIMTDGMTFREIGQTGLRQFSGWVREEFLQTLVGRQAAQKFREMMDNSPTVGGMLTSIQSTMRKVEWRVLPADDSPAAQEAADFVDSCRTDMSHSWEDLVVENLSMLPFGFAPHEIVYKRRLGKHPGPDPMRPGHDLASSEYNDSKIGWRRLPLRGQDNIIKWFFDENGQVKGMTQQPWVGPLIDIPIEKMLLFRPIYYKNNPEGRSILRNAYVSYYYQKRLQEQEAILFERLGGVPVIKIPGWLIEQAQAGDAAATASVNMYKRIAINLRTDEQMGIVLPSDVYPGANGPSSVEQYKFELVAPQMQRSGINFDATITRYSISILTSVLADFLTLGHEARGTQSLAVSKVDMFFQSIEGYLNSMASVYNRYAIPRLWELNGLDQDLRPSIEPDMAQRVDLDVLSNFVLRLSQAGMPLFPNEELQSYILDAGGLPDVTDDRAMQAAGLLDDQLDTQDQKDQATLDRIQAPPVPPQPGKPSVPGSTPLEKILLASLARRQIRMAGPRFGVSSGAGLTKRKRRTQGHVPHAR